MKRATPSRSVAHGVGPIARRRPSALVQAIVGALLLAGTQVAGDVACAPRAVPGPAAPLIAILTYHDIADDTTGAPTMTVSQDFLRRQIRACRSSGWTFLSLRELLEKRAQPELLPQRVMVLTFDDGFLSFRDRVLPVLHEERVPATLAVISSFIRQPPPGMAPLLGWNDLRELARDSLVEIVSHSHDLHRYTSSNPYRDTQPAAATRRYLLSEARYESREEYRSRIAGDLAAAQHALTTELGRGSDVLAWPYGLTNVMAQGIAGLAGFPFTLTVGDCEVSLDDLRSGCLPRVLVTRDLRFGGNDLTWLRRPAPAVRAAQVDFDGLYDPDPAVFSDRVERMIRNVRALGATDVFLQTCSDPDGGGRLNAAWFTNHQVHTRADVWSMVAEKLAHQRIRVWARVPTMNLTWVWDQRPEWRIGGGPAGTQPADAAAERARAAWPTRLSPDLPEARRAAIDFLTDLAVYSPIDGVLFDDDAFMAPGERLTLTRSSDAGERSEAIEELLAECRAAVLAWRPLCVFGRNVPAAVVDARGTHRGLAQDFDRIVRDDGLAVVMADPWANGQGAQAGRWLESLGRRAVRRADAARRSLSSAPASASAAGYSARMISRSAPVLLELPTVDGRTGTRLSGRTLLERVTAIGRSGVANSGLYPIGPGESDVPPRLLDFAIPAAIADGASAGR